MIIQLSDNFRIVRDSYNHQLQELKEVVNPKTKTSSMKWVFIGYFPNVQQCIRRAADVAMLEEEVLSFNEYLTQWASVAEELIGSIKGKYNG